MSAQTILFVPGLNCTPVLFAPQVAALSPRYSCLVADHSRGDSLPAIATAILADAPAQFALCGLSLGGYLALEIMRQAGSRVTRLALLDTQAAPETPAARERRLPRIALAEAGRFAEVEQAVWPEAVHPSRHADDALRQIYATMSQNTGPELWLRHTAAVMARVDSMPLLPSIIVPTLVLVGDSDLITPPERAREMVAAIPNARLVVVPDCGHMSTLERPEAVNAALADWMTW